MDKAGGNRTMKYVIGIDLGTSSVKALLVNELGEVSLEVSKPYPLYHPKPGYSEQSPEDWVKQTKEVLAELVERFDGEPGDIAGISFSGQMHGLVLLDEEYEVLRPAILWNDTRTTKQCEEIYETAGKERILSITKNPALEGFTLPKLLWVKEHEPALFEKAAVFMLPKDYVRFKMTGTIHSEYSDAAGTLLLDVPNKKWSKEICEIFGIKESLCPPLLESHGLAGTLTAAFAASTGLSPETRVFAGGADNACGAIGANILAKGATLCSIGTSGVILSYEAEKDLDFGGVVHYFNHGKEDAFYTMGVTLSAGHSLSWFKEQLAKEETMEQLLEGVGDIPPGAHGLLFAPYLTGERTPHPDAMIRASFIGLDATHTRTDLARAVMEGITFSLNESIEIFREKGKEIDTIVSIGGGAKNPAWLQMQADIFQAKVVTLRGEQGPALGAAILAAYGSGIFASLEECAKVFTSYKDEYVPNPERAEQYRKLYALYQKVYPQTRELCKGLMEFR